MKIERNQRYQTMSVYAFGVLAAVIAFYWVLTNFPTVWGGAMKVLRPIKPVLYGFVVAYLLNPIMVWIEETLGRLTPYGKLSLRVRRAVSVLLTYLITIAVLISFLVIILPQVASNATTLAGQLQSYAAAANNLINDLLESIPEGMIPPTYFERMSQSLEGGVRRLFSWISSGIPRAFSLAWQLGSGVVSACVAVIVSVYLLLAKETFMAQVRKIACAFLSRRQVRRLGAIAATTHMMFGRFITGKIIDSIIIGILCFIGLSIMKMPNVILVSFIVGVTNVLPYFGPFIGAVPGFLLIAFVSPVQGAIFLIFILVLQQIDGNIIGPMILGDSIGLSAFWVVFAILLFGGVFGPVGMFIGVPAFGVIYALLKELVVARLQHRNLPVDTGDYLSRIPPLEEEKEP